MNMITTVPAVGKPPGPRFKPARIRIEQTAGGAVVCIIPVTPMREHAPAHEHALCWSEAWHFAWCAVPDLVGMPGPLTLIAEQVPDYTAADLLRNDAILSKLYEPTLRKQVATVGELAEAVLRYVTRARMAHLEAQASRRGPLCLLD